MSVTYEPTCDHVDSDSDYVCDLCKLVLGEVAGCNHVLDASGKCINCGAYFDNVITYKHVDNNGDGVCDNCGLAMDYKIETEGNLPEYEYTYGTGNNDYAIVTP